MRHSSPNRTVSRGTQTLEMSDYPSALNMMYRTLSPAPGTGRKIRSNHHHHHHRTEETKLFRKEPKNPMMVTTTKTTTEVNKADATFTNAETITTSPTATKHHPAVLDVGKIVGFIQSDGTERLAMISEMTTFHESRIVIVCAWLYTRADINEDLIDNADFSSEESHKYLQSMWPIINDDGTLITSSGRSQCDYMVSTKRTIIVSDAMGTSLNAVSPLIATKVSRDAIYHADSAERRICNVDEGSCYWLEKIL